MLQGGKVIGLDETEMLGGLVELDWTWNLHGRTDWRTDEWTLAGGFIVFFLRNVFFISVGKSKRGRNRTGEEDQDCMNCL